jgi:transposase
MKDENSVPTAQKMTDVSLSIFRLKQKTRIQMIDDNLRDLTRMRASLSQEASPISSRVQKVLKDANVKLESVATNTLGKSGRAMLEEIIAGQNDPEYLASLGHLERSDHITAFCSGACSINCVLVEHEIELLDERLADIGRERPELSQAVTRWDTIPGIDRVAG